ncbi:MAG: PSD1 and planctomycete cytochrome C domain-containing protein [Bryobacteraceae bacterium]|nr:PSD1 and planctomycete cytochrome C domain-containing protein [Bryobacteraceae bacterium]
MRIWLFLSICGLADGNDRLLTLLAKECGSCHSGGKAQGGLSVASMDGLRRGGKHGPALEPGASARSLLVQHITGEKTPQMPLGSSLPPSFLADLRAVIDSLPATPTVTKRDPHWDWLLHAPTAPVLPAVKRQEWVRNPIDRFVLAKLEPLAIQPAPEASRRTLIRRVYFDLLGLPPTPEQVRAFTTSQDPQAYEKLIDQLLADPRYGERWGRHWLDLVRYAESDGFAIDGERPTAWRYRDYVIRAFNQDKPYDLFVQEQIAGDEYRGKKPAPPADRLVALGFLRFAPWEADANSKKQLRQDHLNDITATVGSVFLGMTTGCAQCHDHKYDPIPQKDYYRLQAFFAGTAVADLPVPFHEVEQPKEKKRLMRQHEDAAEAAEMALDQQREELKQRYMKLFAVPASDEGLKKFLGKLNTKNLFFLEQDLPLVKEPDWRGPLRSYFDTRDRMQREQELAKRYQPVAYAVKDVAPPAAPDVPDTYVLSGGDLAARGEKVEAGFLSCATGQSAPAQIPFAGGSNGRRLALAEWIASPQNPFTARVMVNRLWQRHFGEGLVRTPSDFGKNGDPPSHPELLDWLATQFVEKQWSLKVMHRLMLTSATYRQASRHPEQEKLAAQDPANRLLWRMNWQRLDAEALRDSILSVSGKLNPAAGGPPVLFDVPEDVAQGFEFFKWYPSTEEEQRRRSIYLIQRRSVLLPMAETFDAPNLSSSCSRRQSTIVAPQALTLLNGSLTRAAARDLAQRLKDSPDPPQEAFWLALGRPPSAQERAQVEKLMAQGPEGLASLGAVLFNLNEFLYVE